MLLPIQPCKSRVTAMHSERAGQTLRTPRHRSAGYLWLLPKRDAKRLQLLARTNEVIAQEADVAVPLWLIISVVVVKLFVSFRPVVVRQFQYWLP